MDTYAISEIFVSIQGEGPFIGHPAIFVRFAGCNLTCDFCDTDHTVQKNLSFSALTEELKQVMLKNPCISLLVLTGGEPLLHDLIPLVNWYLQFPKTLVQVETNGTQRNDGWMDAITIPHRVFFVCSPKSAELHPNFTGYNAKFLVDEKGVVHGMGLFLQMLADPDRAHKIYIQPLDTKDPVRNKAIMEQALSICYATGAKLSPQLHKLIDVK